MKLFTGWVLAAGLVCAGSAADAQMLSPYSRVSDFGGPYSEAPYGRPYGEAPYRGGPYYAAPPQEVVPAPPRYGYGYGPAPALLPVHEVYNVIREAGFSPLGIPQQRGYVYTIAVIDRGGEDGRLVIDGRSGRIIRFMPAWQMGGTFNDTLNMTHGPAAGVPPQAQATQAATQVRGTPRPPGSVPRVASRTVPVPKASPLARPAVAEPAPAKAAEVPQQSAAVQTKPAEASPPPVATATIGQAKPAAPAIMPTQDMPKAQGLD